MDAAFLKARIEATKAQIIAYEDAAASLGTNGVQSYTLDTGQSRQTVTRLDLPSIQGKIDSLYNRLVILQARLTGNGVVTGVPGW